MAHQFKLTDLFKAIHSAVDEAVDVSRSAAERWLKGFFEEENGRLEPKYIVMRLPIIENGGIVEKEIQIPLFSLANHQSLSLDELKINFEVDMHSCEEGHAMISTGSKWLSTPTKAKVEMHFKGGTPSEGILRINDILVKTIPK